MYIFDRMLFNVGAMKAGTSWLYELLKEHPDIDTVPIKEIHFFWDKHGDFGLLSDVQRIETARYHINRLLPQTPLRSVPALLDWFKLYLAGPVDDVWLANLFTHRGERAYCAEFSNMYALLPPQGWAHVKHLTREVRVTYGLRSPMQRMWSHARFHASIIGQYDTMADWSVETYAHFLSESGCFRHGAYSMTIEAILAAAGRENCLVWQFSDIERDPAALMRTFEDFLAIRHVAYAPETFAVRHNVTQWRTPPHAFIEAAAPAVRAELEALDRLGFTVPDDLAS
ncbi:sulfotransferase domain-containing protein [Acidisoma sp.]|uniref:sulfotransferase domain-containing protein n=1 Tax=Acidisoma sp. TaxID=1872115 RepID=UPI003B00B175